MRIQKTLVLESGEGDQAETGWTISFSRDGDYIQIGMHWNEKPIPTHAFVVKASDFNNMLTEILS